MNGWISPEQIAAIKAIIAKPSVTVHIDNDTESLLITTAATRRKVWGGGPHMMRLRQLGLSSLEEYYDSSTWQRIRKTWPGDWRCFVCESTEEVCLHHCSYMRLGKERPTDLIPLCRNHHNEVHAAIRQRPRICRGLSDGHLYVAERYRERLSAAV